MVWSTVRAGTTACGLAVLISGTACHRDAGESGVEPTTSGTTTPVVTSGSQTRPNFVIFLLDDVGVDMTDAWGADTPAITPVMDQLASESVRFTSAYASPVCTPTRAELLTGRYNHRYGLTSVAPYHAAHDGLADSEVTLAEALKPAGYATAIVGKWHLSTFQHHGTRHALEAGFDHHHGAMGNLHEVSSIDGVSPMNYYDWEKVVDGEVAWTQTYATTDNANEVLALIEELPEPWMIYVPFFAPHEPFDVPPEGMYTGSLVATDPAADRYVAVLEALDREMGRILEVVDAQPSTWVVLAGDNGTPSQVVGPNSKKTAYEAGVHVPFLIRGPGLEPGEVDHLTHVIDIFPTVLDLADVPYDEGPLDGRSLAPVLLDRSAPERHDTIYSGRCRPPFTDTPTVASRMLRNRDWKVLERLDSGVWRTEFYDMRGVQTEGDDLLASGPMEAEAQQAYDALAAELDALLVGQPRP